MAIAADAFGNLFISDLGNARIRRVSTSGIITTVAGNGVAGFSGDNGPAVNARLGYSYGIAVDGQGNLFVTDSASYRIRKVSTNGIITTVAGNGIFGFSGDSGPAISASLNSPYGIALDGSGNLFFSDTYNKRIRKISANGIITTVAGAGVPAGNVQFGEPVGIACDSSGNLFVTDAGDLTTGILSSVWELSTDGTVTIVAGNTGGAVLGDGGFSTSAYLNRANGVAVDSSGNLFIADEFNARVRKVSTSGIITTVAGNGTGSYSGDGGPASAAQMYGPWGVGVDGSGNVFVSDQFNGRVRKIDTNGIITTVAGITPVNCAGNGAIFGDGGPAILAQLCFITGLAVDSSGNIFIADPRDVLVRKVSADGTILTVVSKNDSGFLSGPQGVAVDGAGDLFFTDLSGVWKVAANGTISRVVVGGSTPSAGDSTTDAPLYGPYGVAVDASGNLFIADTLNNRVRMVSTNGIITTVAGNGIQGFSGDGGLATSAQLYRPYQVTLDRAGNLIIADSDNNRIRQVSTNGIISTIAGNGAGNSSGA